VPVWGHDRQGADRLVEPAGDRSRPWVGRKQPVRVRLERRERCHVDQPAAPPLPWQWMSGVAAGVAVAPRGCAQCRDNRLAKPSGDGHDADHCDCAGSARGCGVDRRPRRGPHRRPGCGRSSTTSSPAPIWTGAACASSFRMAPVAAPCRCRSRLCTARCTRRVSRLTVLIALGTHAAMQHTALAGHLGYPLGQLSETHPGITVRNHEFWDAGDLRRGRHDIRRSARRAVRGMLRQEVRVRLNRAVVEHDVTLIVGPVFACSPAYRGRTSSTSHTGPRTRGPRRRSSAPPPRPIPFRLDRAPAAASFTDLSNLLASPPCGSATTPGNRLSSHTSGGGMEGGPAAPDHLTTPSLLT
jgi:hypothetical protein